MKSLLAGILGAISLAALASTASAETTLTIATVNNGDMIRMQGLTEDFTKNNPDIKLEWVTLEENVLREKVTTDIATKGGQFDVLTIGTYEVPIWGKKGWLVPLTQVDDPADLLPAIAGGLTVDGKLMAAPFYGESSMVMYRTDLVEAAGEKMPDAPTWADIKRIAGKITNKDKEIYGVCLRGKAGWGENMAFLTATSNSFGARWFDENWAPQFDQKEWKDTLDFYLELMKADGPPGLGKRGNWLWAWSLAIPAGTQKEEAAQKFIGWATSKGYTELVASKEGWANVPPGTRTSLYANPEYAKVPFAKMTLDSINSADPTKPTVKPVPYVGVQFVAIPEFAGIATSVGQIFSAALAGEKTSDEALAEAQAVTTREMTKAGYIK